MARGFRFRPVHATQDAGAYVQLSGVLKRVATKLSKICNDLRLLASGPRAGLHEINLPAIGIEASVRKRRNRKAWIHSANRENRWAIRRVFHREIEAFGYECPPKLLVGEDVVA